jgi:hypothetical protein
MDSHFWDIIRDIRSLIQKPDDALFIVHPPIEAIAIDRFVYGLKPASSSSKRMMRMGGS